MTIMTIQKNRNSCTGLTWNWKDWSWRLSFKRYSDRSFLVQAKQDTDAYLDKIVFKDCKEREVVQKDFLQLGVHPSAHVASVFSNPGKTRFVH